MKFVSEKVKALVCVCHTFIGVCVATESRRSIDDDCMTFVLATDAEYTDKTAVAILSVILNCSGPLRFIVFVGKNVKTKSLKETRGPEPNEIQKIEKLRNITRFSGNVCIDIIDLMDSNNKIFENLIVQLKNHVSTYGENLFMWLRLYVPTLIKI